MPATPARSAPRRYLARRVSYGLISLAVFAGCARTTTESGPSPASADAAWVEQTLEGLTLRRKVAQLVFPRIPGGFLPVESDTWQRIEGWVEDDGVGGVIATIGPPMEAATTFNALQGLADVPLLVTADMEHGPGQLLNGGTILPYGMDNGSATRFPPAMALGATGEERFAFELGRITALEARAVGVHLTFAPVVDVNNNPDNPIINTRSYGADPDLVARFAQAHIRGLQENGMLATAKHFPGHGDTGTDSHIELPVITVDPARADSIELVPYRAAVAAGVSAVMSAHIAFPALTGDSLPATLSGAVMTDLLRERLGFDGIVTTDAMDMGAIVKGYGATEAPVLALRAGADLLLQVNPEDVRPVIDAIVAAVVDGTLSQDRIDASVRRILGAKARLGLHRQRTVELARVPSRLSTDAHRRIAQEAADRSITLVRDRETMLPLKGDRILSVVVASDPDPWTGRIFQRELTEALPGVETVTVQPDASAETLERIRGLARFADVVVLSPFIRVGAYKGDLAVPEPVATLMRDLVRLRPSVMVSFGNPYLLRQFPEVGTYVLAWGQWEAPQRAAARALAGVIPISGRLPIQLPPEFDVGDGLTVDPDAAIRRPASPEATSLVAPLPTELPDAVGFDPGLATEIDRILQKGLVEGVAPGAVVAVGRWGRLAVGRAEGRLDRSEGSPAVTDSTIYDLASLTKVVATTTAVMMLVDDGLLDLDAPVSRYLPEFAVNPAADRITIRNLLRHDSGLPTWEAFYHNLRGRRPYLLAIANTQPKFEPGAQTEYSDLGAILLGLLVERVSGKPLDHFAQDRIFGPLGMRDTGFNPLLWGRAEGEDGDRIAGLPPVLERIAPTELDTIFRYRHLRGEVHDENAWAMGGVAGHAGLFSSARDLARFAEMLIDGGVYGNVRILREATVRQFTTRQSEASSRALGWDTPSSGGSAGDLFPPSAFGHTGFTGTSLWIDPERDLFIVLLTNRINPTRDNPRIGSLRKAVHNAVQQAVRVDSPVDRQGGR